MFCVWVENPTGMFSVGSFPLIAIKVPWLTPSTVSKIVSFDLHKSFDYIDSTEGVTYVTISHAFIHMV